MTTPLDQVPPTTSIRHPFYTFFELLLGGAHLALIGYMLYSLAAIWWGGNTHSTDAGLIVLFFVTVASLSSSVLVYLWRWRQATLLYDQVGNPELFLDLSALTGFVVVTLAVITAIITGLCFLVIVINNKWHTLWHPLTGLGALGIIQGFFLWHLHHRHTHWRGLLKTPQKTLR